MGEPEAHGKMILASALSERFDPDSALCRFGFGPGAGHATVDGVVAGCIAVEIESRVNKQVRGALMDLVLHPLPLKLLILVKKHGGNPTTSVKQAETILSRFVREGRFRVFSLRAFQRGQASRRTSDWWPKRWPSSSLWTMTARTSADAWIETTGVHLAAA